MSVTEKIAPAQAEHAGPAPLKRTQVLGDLTDNQIAAIRSIPAHDQAVFHTIEETRPASIFLDPARFEAEQATIFRKRAIPVTLSALLPEPGSVMGHDDHGVPLVFTRDKQGVVRCFLNACMHKGSKLVETCEARRAGKMTCPYHAWTFGLDGALIAVPREETFENLDKAERHLAELPVREEGGLVWVMLDRAAEPDFSSLDAQASADLEAFDLDRMTVYGRKRFELNANWKLVLEPFLEGYHVQRLHARSVGPMFADVPTVTHQLGRNIRQTSGKMNFTPDCLDIPGENIHKSVTHAYQMFPNCVVITSPYYISVMFIVPQAAGKTVVDYIMLTRTKADNDKAAELYRKSYEMVLGVFGNEDFRAAELSHAGLSSGALETVVYSGLESTIPVYYKTLESLL